MDVESGLGGVRLCPSDLRRAFEEEGLVKARARK